MYELRVPIPELQHEFFDDLGFVGRTDFWWELQRLIGEFDGRVKYQRDGYAGNLDPSEVVWQEKRREDRLRPQAAGLLRWTWREAYDVRLFRGVMGRAGLLPEQ